MLKWRLLSSTTPGRITGLLFNTVYLAASKLLDIGSRLQAPVGEDFRGIFIVIIVEDHISTIKFIPPVFQISGTRGCFKEM
jgi:hypothetical protein